MPDTNNSSAPVGNVPNDSEDFRNLPQNAEGFRSILKTSERKESHTLSVREVARMFEAASVARTERSITNWCHPNKLGISRLDAYFDPNEKKFFITPQSVELAIKEEQAKAAQSAGSEAGGTAPNGSEGETDTDEVTVGGETKIVRELQREITDLKITNKAKDMFIEQLQHEREDFVEKLMTSSHRLGELEVKLLQLEAPNKDAK